MKTFIGINRMIFSLNRGLFITAVLLYLATTFIDLDALDTVSYWFVNVAYFFLAIGALSCFVEYFIRRHAKDKEPIFLFYYQFIGLVILMFYSVLISSIG